MHGLGRRACTRMRPRGSITHDDPGHALAALESGKARIKHVDAVLQRRRRAASRASARRSRARRRRPSIPRPGEALGTIRTRAPLTAAIVGTIACHASSQINIAIVPKRVSKTPSCATARKKALFVENAVGRQEHLAVKVHDPLAVRLDCEIERAVVIRPAVVFEEPGRDVDSSSRPPRATPAPGRARNSAPEARDRRPRLRESIPSARLREAR